MSNVRKLAFLCMLLCWACVASADVVGLLYSERAPAYQALGEVVQAELERGGVTVVSAQAVDANPLEVLHAKSPKVIITLGAGALRTMLAAESKVPVVAGLIPRASFERVMREPGRKSTGFVHALFLDQPFGRQIDLVQLVNPDARRIGVLWGGESLPLRHLLQATLAARSMSEVAGVVSPTVGLGDATRQALDDVDVLLAVADPAVFNSATVSNVLMASYRAKVGVYAFSPAYVKAGALVALYSSPSQVGLHLADTIRALLRGAVVPAQQYPADFTVSVNEHVARSLGLNLDESALTQRLKRLERKQ